MKKIYVFILTILFVTTLAGCSFSFTTTTTNSILTTGTTTVTQPTTQTSTATEIDLDALKSAIYDRIYADLYDQIRAEVIQNISQERFDEIYNEVVTSLLDKIASGEIEVSAASLIDMIYEVAANQAQAVIGVSAYDSDGTTLNAIGSGVIYKHVGDLYYVVTNNHVVADGTVYKIVFEDGSTIDATLRGVDTLVDLAVLYFSSTKDYTVAAFADSNELQKGTIVLAVGNPSGYDYFRSMTMGIVSGTSRYFDIDGDQTKDMFVGYIQHDASINAGNSGGALFNLQGEVVGINVIKIAATEIEGMGFAIPSTLVHDICNDIEQYGVSKQKPVLGIEFIDVSSGQDYFAYYSIVIPSEITNGFYINSVVAGATLDGIVEPGDIILKIGDIEIINTADFVTNFSSRYRVGDIIDIVIYRNRSTMTITDIELKAKPEA
jgi:serine protease Do